jgi:hypothetical protein
MSFIQVGNSNRPHASFLSKASISSTMAFFYILLSSKFTTSLIVLGSSSMIDQEKLEQKLGGLYLSSFLVSLIDLINTRV